MSENRGLPFERVGRRFMKFAEKKLQKGINYLEAQVNSANTSQGVPYNYNATHPDFSHLESTVSSLPPKTSATNAGYHVPNVGSSTYNTTPPPPPFHGTPAPPTPYTEPFPQPNTANSSTAALQTPNTLTNNLFNASEPIITQDLLFQMQARIPSACISLGLSTVKEARKGVSRILYPTRQDIDLFGMQLKNSQTEAVEPNWHNVEDELPCFAISYVHHSAQGRYKFSDGQWANFHTVVEAIGAAGVQQFRVWLDQCLWLRDASQHNWAHTGIVPYVLWPVIALGAKAPGGERTKDSFDRMWPFVEQIAGLWGMGLIVANEYRSHNMVEGDQRCWLSYNLRMKTEPEQDVMILLLNIFHGAADALETGWEDDVRELKEIAKANVMYANEQVIIGSDWKSRFSSISPLARYQAIQNIQMPIKAQYLGGFDVYLDGSRTLKCDGWQGVREWLSGNDGPAPFEEHDLQMLEIGIEKYNVMTNVGEYQLLRKDSVTSALWLVVAMQGRSSNFSRGRVAWTKVLAGPGSSRMLEMIEKGDMNGVQRILREELRNPNLHIQSANQVNNLIQWV